ncbi:MAG: hypothetical protein CFE49_02820 [Pseudomonas sp. PGPPP3]|nr:MAG: hypothetical protein CFE49_02820 [Pseudomonas sp. PGPPP3]
MSQQSLFPTLALILAAGQGTRMRSSLPKVMHQVGNRPLLGHVLVTALQVGVERLAVVLGPDSPAVADYVQQVAPHALRFVQRERLGGAAVAVAGFTSAQPGPYGRLLVADGKLTAIREAKDASPAELAINLCNGGVMGFRADHCLWLLERIGNANAQGEFYLTDAVELANAAGLAVVAVEVDEEEILGVNDREQLHAAEQVFQRRRRSRAMREGVTLVAAETVFFSADTELAADVKVEPCVVFGLGVRVCQGACVAAFSRLENICIEAAERT